MSIATVRTLIQEKFAYTADDKQIIKDGEPVASDKKEPQKSAHPMEKFRKVVKSILGATTTEEDAEIENVIDFEALFRLATKHGLAPTVLTNLEVIKVELGKSKKKRDSDVISNAWALVKENIPYWFLGVLPSKDDAAQEDKQLVTQLLDVMSYFNKESEKAGKENTKNTEHAGKAIDSKDKKFKNALESVEQKAERPKVPESNSEKDTPKKNEDKYKA